MGKKFKPPDFTNGILELRYDNEEVCIYATAAGLRKLIEFCEALLARGHGHTHLEDYEILTDNSLKGALAIFEGPRTKAGGKIKSGSRGELYRP